MQSSTVTRPTHHSNASRSLLFQNPWTQSTAELNPTPPELPLPKNDDSGQDSNYSASASASPSTTSAFLGLPSLRTAFSLQGISSILGITGAAALAIPISIERVRALELHQPHPPVKVVKPDWGRLSSSAAAATSLKATWLGHAVRAAFPPSPEKSSSPLLFPRVISSSSRVAPPLTSPLESCSTPSSPAAPARRPGLASSAVCLPPVPSRSFPSSNSWPTLIISVFFCLLRDDGTVPSLYSSLKNEILQL